MVKSCLFNCYKMLNNVHFVTYESDECICILSVDVNIRSINQKSINLQSQISIFSFLINNWIISVELQLLKNQIIL